CFSGAASHNNLPTISRLKARYDITNCFVLVRTRLRWRLALCYRQSRYIVWIINGGSFKMRQMIPNDGLFLRVQHLSRICADTICRYDQKSVTQEPINVRLCYFVAWGIAFSLNSPDASGFISKDKIDTAIPTPSTRIVFPQPDF